MVQTYDRLGTLRNSLHRTAPTKSETQDILPSKWKMRLACQWQMSEAKERRRLFEDETGRNFGQHAGETSLSFESFAERRPRERLTAAVFRRQRICRRWRRTSARGRRPPTPGMRKNGRMPSHIADQSRRWR